MEFDLVVVKTVRSLCSITSHYNDFFDIVIFYNTYASDIANKKS